MNTPKHPENTDPNLSESTEKAPLHGPPDERSESFDHQPGLGQEDELSCTAGTGRAELVQVDPRTVREFRAWFAKRHRVSVGVKYRGDDNRKENDIVRTLLRRFPLDKLQDLSDLFLRTELWPGCRKQHTIGVMLYLINRGWPDAQLGELMSSAIQPSPETSAAAFEEMSRQLKEQRDRFLRGEDTD